MKHLVTVCAMVALVSCSPKTEETPAPAPAETAAPTPAEVEVPGGIYTLDPTHTSLTFRVNHLGLSNYTARFTKIEGELKLNPENPASSSVSIRIDPRSIRTDFPDPKLDFDAELAGRSWLDAEQFPVMTFQSTGIDLTGPNTARVTGDLDMHGVTRPVSFNATYNGGYASQPMDTAGSRIGFSARGTLNRSNFSIAYGIPPEGSSMGVGDLVAFEIETEFVRPLDAPAPKAAPTKK